MIRLGDGIEIRGSRRIVMDGKKASGELNFVSHAHFDHLPSREARILCSEETAALARARTGKEFQRVEGESVELIPSGHIIGSSAAVVEGEDKVLYTGDVSTRERAYLPGFEPVDADILVLETTYGVPAYRFPDQEELEKRIKDWVEDSRKPLFLFAYSLGKAQKIQHLIQEVTEGPVLASQKVFEMNETVASITDLKFRAEEFKKDRMDEDTVFIGPTSLARKKWVNSLVERLGGVKAGFSGWAVDDSYIFRGGYDRAFPFSDHCDFDDLVSVVEKVEPDRVYTHHGFDEAFASYLSREKGFSARALEQDQSSLAEFQK